MRVLEAHFHPASRSASGQSYVIGRVYCDAGAVTVEPVLSAFESTAPIEKLRYLVASAGGDPYTRLLGLQSDFWSFSAAECAE